MASIHKTSKHTHLVDHVEQLHRPQIDSVKEMNPKNRFRTSAMQEPQWQFSNDLFSSHLSTSGKPEGKPLASNVSTTPKNLGKSKKSRNRVHREGLDGAAAAAKVNLVHREGLDGAAAAAKVNPSKRPSRRRKILKTDLEEFETTLEALGFLSLVDEKPPQEQDYGLDEMTLNTLSLEARKNAVEYAKYSLLMDSIDLHKIPEKDKAQWKETIKTKYMDIEKEEVIKYLFEQVHKRLKFENAAELNYRFPDVPEDSLSDFNVESLRHAKEEFFLGDFSEHLNRENKTVPELIEKIYMLAQNRTARDIPEYVRRQNSASDGKVPQQTPIGQAALAQPRSLRTDLNVINNLKFDSSLIE